MLQRIGFLLVLLAISNADLCAQSGPWPAWRGDGSGVSADAELPVEWGPDRNIVWKTKIEGDGISSPIVWGDKVFVTTAVEGSETVVSQVLVAVGCGALLLLALASAVIAKGPGHDRPEAGPSCPPWLKGAYRLDRAAFFLTTLAFMLSLIVVISGKGASLTLRIISIIVNVPPGNVFRAWLISGLAAALGLIAAVGFTAPRSVWRPVGAALLAAAALYLVLETPLDQHTRAIPVEVLLLLSGPLLVAAAWYVAIFILTRLYHGKAGWTSRAHALFPLGIVAAAALAFAYANFLQPRTGMWRAVVCLDLNSGEILFIKNAFLAPAGRKYRGNSYATPTPVTDGEYLLAHYGSGMVMMDLDGNIKWEKMIPEFEKYLRYGAASSPVMYEDLVIYAFMAEGGGGHEGLWGGKYSYLVALDKETGDEVWKVSPVPEGHDSYGTPLVVRDGDRATVLLSTYNHCLAYDANTGAQLWWVEVPLEQPVPSIVADAENAYLAGGLHGPAVAAAIRLGGRGNVSETHVEWKITKGITGTSSPILYQGLLYWVTEKGILHCLEPESGELVWRERIPGRYFGSPVAAGGRIYLPATDGSVSVIEAGRQFNLLAVNSIGEESYSSPAISRGRILLRGRNHLYCISAQ